MQLEKNKWYTTDHAKYLTEDTTLLMELWEEDLYFGIYDADTKKFQSWTSGNAGELNDDEVTAFFIPEENKLSH